MPKEKRIRVETKITRDGSDTKTRMQLPRVAREYLGAQINDHLVFEEGSFRAAELAAASGRYLILRLAPSPRPADEVAVKTQDASTQSAPVAMPERPLVDDVQRKIEERSQSPLST